MSRILLKMSDSCLTRSISWFLVFPYRSLLNSGIFNRTKLKRKPRFSIVSALLRLGKKYDIESLYEDALERLQSEFPSSLSAYLELSDTFSFIEYHPGLLHDCINLALETNTLSILPTAYLFSQCEMARLPLSIST